MWLLLEASLLELLWKELQDCPEGLTMVGNIEKVNLRMVTSRKELGIAEREVLWKFGKLWNIRNRHISPLRPVEYQGKWFLASGHRFGWARLAWSARCGVVIVLD